MCVHALYYENHIWVEIQAYETIIPAMKEERMNLMAAIFLVGLVTTVIHFTPRRPLEAYRLLESRLAKLETSKPLILTDLEVRLDQAEARLSNIEQIVKQPDATKKQKKTYAGSVRTRQQRA